MIEIEHPSQTNDLPYFVLYKIITGPMFWRFMSKKQYREKKKELEEIARKKNIPQKLMNIISVLDDEKTAEQVADALGIDIDTARASIRKCVKIGIVVMVRKAVGRWKIPALYVKAK
jgi:predicted HTH transcriptional regulator